MREVQVDVIVGGLLSGCNEVFVLEPLFQPSCLGATPVVPLFPPLLVCGLEVRVFELWLRAFHFAPAGITKGTSVERPKSILGKMLLADLAGEPSKKRGKRRDGLEEPVEVDACGCFVGFCCLILS